MSHYGVERQRPGHGEHSTVARLDRSCSSVAHGEPQFARQVIRPSGVAALGYNRLSKEIDGRQRKGPVDDPFIGRQIHHSHNDR